MECGDEEAPQESTRRGTWQIGWPGPERGQETGQSRKRSQRRPRQKPQEKTGRPAQRQAPTTGAAPQGGVSAVIASIRARFGYRAIGLGYGGIRFSARALR
jgi:hypothetical protein